MRQGDGGLDGIGEVQIRNTSLRCQQLPPGIVGLRKYLS